MIGDYNDRHRHLASCVWGNPYKRCAMHQVRRGYRPAQARTARVQSLPRLWRQYRQDRTVYVDNRTHTEGSLYTYHPQERSARSQSKAKMNLYGETHTQSRPVLGVAMCGMLSVAKRYLRSATVVHVCNGLPRMGFPIPSHSELLHT